jgi:hypothetical protein
MVLKEKMFVEYKDIRGKIVFVCDDYVTFTPINTAALLVVYRKDWSNVTVL